MVIHHPTLNEPHGMPLRFRDSTGEWHLFGHQWFEENAEHYVLEDVMVYSTELPWYGQANLSWQGICDDYVHLFARQAE